jgi:hypothetical protein
VINKLLTFCYFIHENFFRLLWKIEDVVLPYFMTNKKYSFKRVTEGSGLLHKYIMTNNFNGKKYFVKKPTLLTDIWQYSQRKFKYVLKIDDDYKSLTRQSIKQIINIFLSKNELKDLSIVILVSSSYSIVYKFIENIKLISNENNISEVLDVLEKNGFKFMDIHNDNFIILDNKIIIIDLESLVTIEGGVCKD